MPFVGVLLMLLLNDNINDVVPVETRKYIVTISLLLTIIIPAILFLLFFKMGWVSDLNLTVRKERILPTFIVLLLFFILYYLVRNATGVSIAFVSILLGSIVGILIANIVTAFWKISIHSLGITSVVGSLVALFYATGEMLPIAVYVLMGIAIIVGGSRIILKRHTPMQVVMGSILGFLSPFVASYFEWYI
jgi:membrane-associated phospholipid phosphatase